jgi:uncharacterized C2H2 Zn-finger protein
VENNESLVLLKEEDGDEELEEDFEDLDDYGHESDLEQNYPSGFCETLIDEEEYFDEDNSSKSDDKTKVKSRLKRGQPRKGALKRQVYKCEHCDYECTAKHDMRKHMSKLHKVPQYHKTCKFCDFKCYRKHKLAMHMRTVHNEEPPKDFLHQCPQCEKEFDSKTELMKHVHKYHDSSYEGIFPNQTPPKPKLHQCDQCEFKTKTLSVLVNHQKVRHLNLREYLCSLCGKAFGQKRNLKMHVYMKHEESYKTLFPGETIPKTLEEAKVKLDLPCDICGRISKNQRALNAHMRAFHDEKIYKKFQCKVCGLKTTCNKQLEAHMKFRHSDNVPSDFVCLICHLPQGNPGTYKRHMLHDHRDRYKECYPNADIPLPTDVICDDCGKVYKNRNAWWIHQKNVHQPKTAACQYCDHVTVWQSALLKHIQCRHPEKLKAEQSNKV